MANRLTDKQKKKIVADYLELGSYNATAKANGTSPKTVKRVLAEVPEMPEKVKQKKAENTADILAYMESQRGLVCEIIGKGLAVLNDEEKFAGGHPRADHHRAGDTDRQVGGGEWAASADEIKEDGLSKSLREMAEELESDG